jgi:hypothetical protein
LKDNIIKRVTEMVCKDLVDSCGSGKTGEKVVLNQVEFRSGQNICTHFILLRYTTQEEALWWIYPRSRNHNTYILDK